MNIFFVDNDPTKAAKALGDKHVIKMALESAQILCNAKRILYPSLDHSCLYKPTHINHPCCVWARTSGSNYDWLFTHYLSLLTEYHYRWSKVHASDRLLPYLWRGSFWHSNRSGEMTPPALAMPDEYKLPDPVESYRKYYRLAKQDMHHWTLREPPGWIYEQASAA